MEKKHIAYTILGVAAVGGVAWLLYRRFGAGDSGAVPAPVEQPSPQYSLAPQAYTPAVTSYSPVPVGLNTDPNAGSSAAPGVNPSAVTASVPAITYDPSSVHTVAVANSDATTLLHQTGMAAAANTASNPTSTAVQTMSNVAAHPTNADLVNAEYMKVFGRKADQPGLEFWTNQLNNGTLDTSAASIDRALIRGAQGTDIDYAVTNHPADYIGAFTTSPSIAGTK